MDSRFPVILIKALLTPRLYKNFPMFSSSNTKNFHLFALNLRSNLEFVLLHDMRTGFQAPPSLGFSRQEYWSGLPCLPAGDPPDLGVEPAFLMSPALPGGFLPLACPSG